MIHVHTYVHTYIYIYIFYTYCSYSYLEDQKKEELQHDKDLFEIYLVLLVVE